MIATPPALVVNVTPPALAATTGGSLLVLAILLPVIAILLSFAAGGRNAERVTLALTPIGLAIALAITWLVWSSGAPVVYNVADSRRRSALRCARTACPASCC